MITSSSSGEVTHDCSLSVPLGYYLEVLVCLAAFSKKKFNITLRGVTHGQGHPNVSKYTWAVMCGITSHSEIIRHLDLDTKWGELR